MRSMGLRRMARRGHPVFLRLAHRVAALMEGIGEEVGQKAALGVFDARDVTDETQRAAVSDAAHHGIRPMLLNSSMNGSVPIQ